MAAVDPNIYALSIQLQLDTSLANNALNEFVGIIKNVEQDVSKAATAAVNAISSITSGIKASLSESVTGFSLIDGYVTGIKEANGAIEKNANNQLIAQQKINDLIIEHKEQNDLIDKQQIKSLDFMKSSRNLLTNNKTISDAIVANGQKENTSWMTLTKNLFGFNKVLDDKNKKHDAENAKLKREETTWRDVASAVQSVIGFFSEIDSGTENFVTANYRLYGTQQELLNSTRMLNAELGIGAEKSIEVVKSLADVGTPLEDMAKLSRSVGIATRTTGVAATTLADYTRKLRLAGMNAAGVSKNLELVTANMRKFGLTTQDVNGILNKNDEYMLVLQRRYGPEGAAQMQGLEMHMAGIAKSAGLSTDEVGKFFQTMQDPVALATFGAMVGMNINNQKDFNIALNRAGAQLGELQDQIKAAAAAGEDTKQLEMAFEATAKAMGMNNAQAQIAIVRHQKLKEAMEREGKSMDDVNEVLAMQAKLEKEELAAANDTLTGQLKILYGYFAALGVILQFAADCVRDFIKVINGLIYAFVWMYQKIKDGIQAVYDFGRYLYDTFEPIKVLVDFFYQVGSVIYDFLSPAFEYLGFVIRAIIGAVLVAILVMAALGGVGITLGGIFSSLLGIFGAAGTGLTTFGGIFTSVARAIGSAIVSFFRTMGDAIAAFIRPVARYIPHLIGLGVALMLVAVAAYILVQAVILLASTESAFAALGLLIVGLIVLAVVLVVLGRVASDPMVMLGIAVIVIALFALAIAAYIAAQAIYVLALAFNLVVDNIIKLYEKVGLGYLIVFGVELVLFGIALIIAAILIGVGGLLLAIAGVLLIIGAVFFGIGALLLWGASTIFGYAINALQPAANKLNPIAGPLAVDAFLIMAAGIMLLIGGVAMILAAIALGIGGAALVVAAYAVTAGGAAMYAATFAIDRAAKFMAKYGEQFRNAGEGFRAGADNLEYAGNKLYNSAGILKSGVKAMGDAANDSKDAIKSLQEMGDALIPASEALITGTVKFEEATGKLESVVPRFSAVVNQLVAASMMFLLSANTLANGTEVFDNSAQLLDAASTTIVDTLPVLEEAINGLDSAAAALNPVAVDLLNAVMQLYPATDGLNQSADLLSLAGIKILQGSSNTALGLSVLSVAFGLMETIANTMAIGAQSMLDSIGIMYEMSIELSSLSGVLLPAALSLAFGLSAIASVVARFEGSAGVMKTLAVNIALIADSFKQLSSIENNKLSELAAGGIAALPTLSTLADEMAAIADKFKSIDLADALTKIGDQLEAYAERVEVISDRIWTAVNVKAMGAIKAADQSGISGAVKSEAISTVRIMKDDDSDKTSTPTEEETVAIKTLTAIEELRDAVVRMAPSGDNQVTTIVELLQSYLPKIAKRDGGLTSEFNAWAK